MAKRFSGISRPSIALMLPVLVLIASGCGKSSSAKRQERFEPFHRAARTINAATSVGVTYPQYTALLQQLAAEIDIARDYVQNDEDAALVAAYREVFSSHEDCKTLWQYVVEGKELKEAEEVLEKYGMRRESIRDISGSRSGTYLEVLALAIDLTMKDIWKEASKKTERATALYLGREDASDAAPQPPKSQGRE